MQNNSMINGSNGMLRVYNGATLPENQSWITENSGNGQSQMSDSVTNQRFPNVVYTVKSGDTLWGISRTYLGTGKKYYEIQSLNHLKDDIIHPGQTLLIPQNPSSGWLLYNVESGDTLWDIARRYLGSWTKYNILMSLNNLQNEKIYPGQILKIPLKTQNNVYIVQPGDTLWSISMKLLGDGNRFYEIIKLNDLQSEQVVEGQNLKIPEN